MTGEVRSASQDDVICSLCGTRVAGSPLTWSMSYGPRGRRWSCGSCTRQHLRALEARLDEEHR